VVDKMKHAFIDRAKGNRPSVPRAAVAAVVVGAVAAGLTYRVLRG
jgi:hypothetical protein